MELRDSYAAPASVAGVEGFPYMCRI